MSRTRVVLVGGGHAHLLALRSLAARPDPMLDCVLVSPSPVSLYSGMAPGCIAGHYGRADLSIDARALALRAGGRFLEDRAIGIDLAGRMLRLAGGEALAWDALSLDVGAAPGLEGPDIVPARPAGTLLDALDAGRFEGASPERPAWVVGAGPAGIEIALALHHRLAPRVDGSPSPVAVVAGRAGLLPGLAASAARRVSAMLAERRIRLVLDRDVILREGGEPALDDGSALPAACLVWAAGLAGQPWVRESGLPTDERGFALVDETLRVTGRDDVFCVGDAACFVKHPLPKAGVHAVRQGSMLARQFSALARGQPLARYRPQADMLVLLATGPRHAIACRNGVSLAGKWAWRWKDRIDRRFVASLR